MEGAMTIIPANVKTSYNTMIQNQNGYTYLPNTLFLPLLVFQVESIFSAAIDFCQRNVAMLSNFLPLSNQTPIFYLNALALFYHSRIPITPLSKYIACSVSFVGINYLCVKKSQKVATPYIKTCMKCCTAIAYT